MSKEVQRNILNLGGDAANVDSVGPFHRSSGNSTSATLLTAWTKVILRQVLKLDDVTDSGSD